MAKNSTYRCKSKNVYNAHIYWVCNRFFVLQLSKRGLVYVDIAFIPAHSHIK